MDPTNSFGLSGKVALVTGGNSGIGEACVERLHDLGTTVAFTYVEALEDADDALERVAFLERLPKRRLIEPEEIAAIVAFLASDLSTPMRGAVIDASMGLGVRPVLMTEGADH